MLGPPPPARIAVWLLFDKAKGRYATGYRWLFRTCEDLSGARVFFKRPHAEAFASKFCGRFTVLRTWAVIGQYSVLDVVEPDVVLRRQSHPLPPYRNPRAPLPEGTTKSQVKRPDLRGMKPVAPPPPRFCAAVDRTTNVGVSVKDLEAVIRALNSRPPGDE